MTCRIFVEGAHQGALISLALEDLKSRYAFRIIVSGDANAAHSMASTALVTSGDPVVLIVDADTTDRAAAKAKEADLNYYLALSAGGKPFKLIQFAPQIEIVFFEVAGLLEAWLKRPVDPVFLEIGGDAPKKVMSVLGASIENLVAGPVAASLVNRLREHRLLAAVREFLRLHASKVSFAEEDSLVMYDGIIVDQKRRPGT